MKKEDGLSDFLKIAYKYNKVRDLEEAFEKYPVAEEWHKGNLDNVLKETDEIYRILNNQILFKIGKVDINKVEEYKKEFYKNVKNKECL